MKNDIKYCVTAFIDLLGFSGHLDVGSNDLRTKIGQEALTRLEFLEDALQKLKNEFESSVEYFPEFYFAQRINDGIIITIDLPEILKPSIGESYKNGIDDQEFQQCFDIEEYPAAVLLQAYSEIIDSSVDSLCKFVGMISRIHNYINSLERKSYFSGAKTVISTGYRKVFTTRDGVEDFLAANFSFSNAYIAENKLHGPKIYIDCYILQLLSNNKYSRNIVKSAVFIEDAKPLGPFLDSKDYLMLHTEFVESKTEHLNLFNKAFYFRKINPKRSSYLQIVPAISQFMKENPEHINKDKIYKHIFSFIVSNKIDKEDARNPFYIYYGIDNSSKILFDLVLFGKSEKNKENSTKIEKYIDWRIDLKN